MIAAPAVGGDLKAVVTTQPVTPFTNDCAIFAVVGVDGRVVNLKEKQIISISRLA